MKKFFTAVPLQHRADGLKLLDYVDDEDELFACMTFGTKPLSQAMKVEFLDFFMAELCRGVDEIADSPLKPYGELVEGRGPEETRLPLPGDVYISYLGRREGVRVGPSAVSQQRTAYVQTVKGWLS